MGSIVPGKKANFVLSSENPLDNLATLTNPQWVMVKGIKLEQKTLEEFVGQAHNRKNGIATALRYMEYLWVDKF